jgi:hypothetical protein
VTALTEGLHRSLIDSLGPAVVEHSALRSKPISLDLELPAPPRLRCYVYSLVFGGKRRPNEFKGVLRVPGQKVGSYGSFDFSGGRFAVVIAYHRDLDVWVLWDSLLHPRFKNGGNIQVRRSVILEAAAAGTARQERSVKSRQTETILCARSSYLLETLTERLVTSGMGSSNG